MAILRLSFVFSLSSLIALYSVWQHMLHARASKPAVLRRLPGASELLRSLSGSSISAWRRVRAVFHETLVLTDVDDTLWSSGAWRLGGKTLGGVDEDLSRGQTYPGIGALYFLLSAGPHVTAAPVNKFLPTCPVPLVSPLFETCQVGDARRSLAGATGRVTDTWVFGGGERAKELQDSRRKPAEKRPLLPPRVGLLTARASSAAMRSFTRSPSFYAAVTAALIHGARQIYGPGVDDWGRVRFENNMELLRDVIGGQHSRGRGKVSGFKEALEKFPKQTPVFVGDSGERDVEAAAGMALFAQEKLAAVFVHVVFSNWVNENPDEIEQAIAAPRATPFNLRFNNRRIPALQLAYDVQANLHPSDPKPESFAALSDTHLYSAGMRVASVMKPLMIAYGHQSRRQRAKPTERHDRRTNKDEEGIRDIVALPIFFLKFRDLTVKRNMSVRRQTTSNPFRKLYSHLSTGLKNSVSKVVDLWAEEEQLRSYTDLRTVPADELGVSSDPGVPFIPYRTALGAGISAFILEMITFQDLINLAVSSIRDFRSLGPPQSCAQQQGLEDLYFDLRYMLEVTGEALQSVHVENRAIFEDGVAAMRTFHTKAVDACIPSGPAEPWTVGEEIGACLALFRNPRAAASPPRDPTDSLPEAAGLGDIPHAVLPLARVVCTFVDQLKHWRSAGADETEVLSLEFSVALNEAVDMSNRPFGIGGQPVTSLANLSGDSTSREVPRPSGTLRMESLPMSPLRDADVASVFPRSLRSRPTSGTVNLSLPIPPGSPGNSSFPQVSLTGQPGDEADARPSGRGNESNFVSSSGFSPLSATSPASDPAPMSPDRAHLYWTKEAERQNVERRSSGAIATSTQAPAASRDIPDSLQIEGTIDSPSSFQSRGASADRQRPQGRIEDGAFASPFLPGLSTTAGPSGQGRTSVDLVRSGALSSRLNAASGAALGDVISAAPSDCPFGGLRKLLATMRPICEHQKKLLGDASPCALMSHLLYEEGLMHIFATVTAWYEDGAREPLYITKMHLTLDPAEAKLETLRKRESDNFAHLGMGVLKRGRGHSTYDIDRLQANHREFARSYPGFKNLSCNPFEA
uniref:Uncharacterized protein n=1 Tax=Toxoplasma gondii COUG TaxID=1074873 RepID=A0A2G8XTS5_TOXGO|nr:hypothetical protein TGCOUG_312420 [Toxoplasma gondii COUG]